MAPVGGRSQGLHSRGFPPGRPTRGDRDQALPFPASPLQSVHKVLPYTAYRRPSPEGMHGAAVRDVPGETFQTDAVTGVDDELHPVTTTSSAVPFGEQHRHPLSDVAVELGEAARGVAVAVVLTPPAQKPVEFFNQQAGRQVVSAIR